MTLMIGSMALDWLFPFAPALMRPLLTAGTLAATAASVFAFGYRPIRSALRWNDAANAVDGEIPQLEERWSTVASLSSRQLSDQTPTQRAMAAQVISEAVAMEQIVQPSRVAPPVSPKPAVAAAAASALLLAGLIAINPSQLSVLMKRFWFPTSPITATQLQSLTGDQFVPRSESIDLITRQDGVQRSRATLTVRDADGTSREYQIGADENASDLFRHRLRVDDSVSYRVRAGDSQTAWQHLRVIDFPELAEVKFAIDFPEYTRQDPVQRDRLPRRVKVAQGSTLRLSLKPLEPLKQLSLAVTHLDRSTGENSSEETQAESEREELIADDSGWYHFQMQLMDDVILAPSLTSPHDLTNQRRLFSRIDVITDKAPVARVVSPNNEMAVAVDETIEIEFEAHDDHGIMTAELVVFDESRKDEQGNPVVVAVKPIPLADQKNSKHVMGKTELDLRDMNLREGSEISYAIRVTDNRDVALASQQTSDPSSTAQAPTAPDKNSDANARDRLAEDSALRSKDAEGVAENPSGPNQNASPESESATPSKDDLSQMLALAPPRFPESDSPGDASPQDREGVSKQPTPQIPTDGSSADLPPADEAPKRPSSTSAPDAEPAGDGLDDEPGDASNDSPADASEANQDPRGSESQGPQTSEGVPSIDPKKGMRGEDSSSEPGTDANPSADGAPADESPDDGNGRPASDPAAESDEVTPGSKPEPSAGNPLDQIAKATTSPPSPADTDPSPRKQSAPTLQAANSPSPKPADTSSKNSPSNAGGSSPKSSASKQVAMTQSAGTQSARPDPKQPNSDPKPAASNPTQPSDPAPKPSGSKVAKSSAGETRPPNQFALKTQQSRSGQDTQTGRRRLKITEKLASIATAETRPGEDRQIRESVVEIDEMLAEVETGLRQLVDRTIADSDRGEQFQRLDLGLGNIESFIADLREETKENQFAFVGLQMVDIARTHVTPARDRVFAATARPNASDVDASVSLQHVVRARELLAALLKRYDRVKQERELKDDMEETATMYEVYLQKRRMLMREARQNRNPLERKMGIVEVDQAYLDRLAEVLQLRRAMLDELAQMLGDDPRLLSRYLELTKRRGDSLRDQLSEISQRQYDATEELLSWLQIDESQKPDLWSIIVDLRVQSASQIAKDTAELAERVEKQMPLEIDSSVGTAAATVAMAKQLASDARSIQFDAEKLVGQAGQVADADSLVHNAGTLVTRCDRLFALFDRLQFENESEPAVADYVDRRMLETRAVANLADAWSELCNSLVAGNYAGVVHTEQLRLAVATQLLRVEMLEMESELEGQFQRLAESSVPGPIVDMIRSLHRLMETITFNQAAASFRASGDTIESASRQQELALQRLEEAEELFDKIRREVVRELDQYDVRDPNIADLRDPTLDEFLARLEREPNIVAQLGIPVRRTNLRVIAESMLWQQQGGGGLGEAGKAAANRAKEAMKMKRAAQQKDDKEKAKERELTDGEREQFAQAKRAQEMLEKSLREIEQRRDDPTTPDGERQRLDKMAKNIERMMEQSDGNNADRRAWDQVVQSDQAQELIRALAAGESLPDEQWNKLLSTLDDGLWQVRGNQPPEAYRKAIEQYQDQIRELMQTIDEG
ncbi:hypothetical protein FYK55_25680 [Roseiconus nitratireducens]|uniref:Uncharacterized protein n=2 Tax=Roseiconus nitratireducens TaxID=2605748 RepID=A0A5M6CVF3_9BACT|nr:hypothetical protein FYK55_25680 [Roseiconus nitratireducens]